MSACVCLSHPKLKYFRNLTSDFSGLSLNVKLLHEFYSPTPYSLPLTSLISSFHFILLFLFGIQVWSLWTLLHKLSVMPSLVLQSKNNLYPLQIENEHLILTAEDFLRLTCLFVLNFQMMKSRSIPIWKDLSNRTISVLWRCLRWQMVTSIQKEESVENGWLQLTAYSFYFYWP